MTVEYTLCVGGAFTHVDSTEPFEEGFFFGVVLPTGVSARFISRAARSTAAVEAAAR
jgi:hypothetical protein